MGKDRLRRKAVEEILKREGEVGLEILAWGGVGGGVRGLESFLRPVCPPLFNSQSFSISVMRRGVLEIFVGFFFFSEFRPETRKPVQS